MRVKYRNPSLTPKIFGRLMAGFHVHGHLIRATNIIIGLDKLCQRIIGTPRNRRIMLE